MRENLVVIISTLLFCYISGSSNAIAVEFELSGLAELDYSYVNNDQDNGLSEIGSFLEGDYGKFDKDFGSSFSLSQAALSLNIEMTNLVSAKLISNAYLGGPKDDVGITEGYLKFKSIPTQKGYRFQSRVGILYPNISMENIATAWSTPYTLTSSSMNSWIAEEVRHRGLETSIERLGKFTNSDIDLRLTGTIFDTNDTSGTLLAWHGWTRSSRQTLLHESIQLPNSEIRQEGAPLNLQANESDPSIEVDGQLGLHLVGSLKWNDIIHLKMGAYDNRAKPYILENGNYAWHTKFSHFGIQINLQNDWRVISQYMSGTTLMQSDQRINVVYNDFSNAFILLSKKIDKHRLTLRLETFEVNDMDDTEPDDNNEDGESLTLAYIYRMDRNYFFHTEYSAIKSDRKSRTYHMQPEALTESKISVAIRYYF